MKRVIVTGATGMIGAGMIGQMLQDEIEVTAVIRPGSAKRRNLAAHPLLEVVECDIDNLLYLKDILAKTYDVFYHFAWNGPYGAGRDDLYLQTQNIKDALDAVEVAHHLHCHAYVGAGSQAEFGHVQGKISDMLLKNPVTGYGIAKLTACNMSRLWCEKYGIRHSWGRIVSTYGPKDNSYTMVMSSIIGMLKGEHLSFTKGEQIWDYLYGGDCSRAFYLIGKYGKHGKAYTIGSGQPRMLKEFMEDIRDVINPELEIGIGEREYYPNQVMHLEADIRELTADTGFQPQVSFKDGIRETVRWYKQISG